MRKKLTLFAAVLVAIAFGFGIKALGWTSTAPADLTDGTYYIYNVGHEQFLHQGNSWGTRASMFPQAYACHVVKNDDGTIKIQPLTGTGWLADNAFMDGGTAASITATAVEGGYKLSNGAKALAWDGAEVNWVEGAEGDNATWQILTVEEMKSGFASVTVDKPVDATFMIKGPRIIRANTEWKNAWTCDPAPAIIDHDPSNEWYAESFQRACAEVWNNSVSVTQEVDLVKGAYKLTVNGFYRFGGKDGAIAAHNDGTEQLNAYLVAGEAKAPLMSICDGKGHTDLNNIPNTQAVAGKAIYDGLYSDNALYFRVENDGPVTIGIKKDVKVNNDWTVYNGFTLTYYGPDATVEDITPKAADMTALKAACEAARAKLGFQVGEYAPYNNAASMQTLADAEAMAAVEQYDQAAVDAMTAAVNSLEWTANEHRLDAVYNGDFLLSENDGAPAGWRQSNNTLGGAAHSRAFVLTEGMTNYEQLAAFQPDNSIRGALFLRFDGNYSDRGSIYAYGQGTNGIQAGTPYCMPLKGGITYNFAADMGGWGSTGRNFKMYIVDAAGQTVGEQTIAPASNCAVVGGTADLFAFEFTPTVTGNCVIYIQCPGSAEGKNCIVTNFSIMAPKSDQTIAWEQDFADLKVGQNVELNATASSGLPVTYEFADAEAAAGIATLDGNKLTFTAEGSVVVNAIQAGNDDWNAAETVSMTIAAEEIKVADVEGLKAACEAARAKLGFEVGECAPYANVAQMEALIEAEAMLAEEGELEYEAVAAKIEAINALQWTANTTRMNAIYNGDFRLGTHDAYAEGWKSTNKNMGGSLTARVFVCNEGDGNYDFLGVLQPEAGTRAALFIRFDDTSSDPGSQYVYGMGTNTAGWANVPTPYVMPLKADVTYTCSAVVGNWNSDFGNVKVYIKDAADQTVGQQTVTPDSKISQGGTTYKTINFDFTPTVDGNCSLWIQNPGASVQHNDVITNFVIMPAKKAQAITWEQEFAGIAVGQTIELTATASSELPVTYAFEDAEDAAGVATLEGNKLTFVADGMVTVIATQAGNDEWKAAEPVSMTIIGGDFALAELPADGYYWIKNVETEQYMIHNGYWGTLTTLGDYGMPVKVATVDGITTLAYADYILSNENWYIFKDGANGSQDVQNVYSDNKGNGSNNSHEWTIVPAGPTSLYIKNLHNGAYMFANTDAEVAYVQTSVAKVANSQWQFVPAAEVAEFVAAKRDAQVAVLAQMAGVEVADEAALESVFNKVEDVTDQVTLPESRGEAYQPGGYGESGKIDNSKEVLSFSIVAPKAGLYKIVVPAMWRNGTNSVTETLANADMDIANTIIYTDDFTGVVLGQSAGATATEYDGAVAITINGETMYVPNGQDSFEAAAIAGRYGNVVYAYAAEDGSTITVKAMTSSGRNQHGQWFVHNAPLTKVYLLEQEEIVKPKKDQTIEWDQEFNGIVLNQPVALTATATSGLEVAYALEVENENATLAGSEITFTANCTVVVVASQEGNDEWNAAEPVKKTIVVETDGISSISADDADALFFNLQGVQIKAPQAGQVYIVVKANRAFKALVK